jgi:GntR family transcriptional regulator
MSAEEQLPKYQIIKNHIVEAIKTGDFKAGMRIPSEREIRDRYGVSNTTARKALHEIELTGWAVRIKGKGTFVKTPAVVRSATKILSFTTNMYQAGYTPSTRVLFQGRVEEGYSAYINGRNYTMKGPVFKIHRLRFADDIPMLLEVRYISCTFCPNILEEDLSGSLYDIYRNKYNLELTRVDQMLSAIIIDSGVKSFFDIEGTVPGFLVDGATFSGKEVILEMEKSIYRGDRYTFAVSAE